MQDLRKLALALPAVALLFLYALFLPPVARADNLTITSGFLHIGGAPMSRNAMRAVGFNFAGNNFVASGGAGDDLTQGVNSGCAFSPCAPGTNVSSGANVTLAGIGQANFGGGSVAAWWLGHDSNLIFTGPSVVIPASASDPTLILTSAFSMSGTVVIHSLDDLSHPILFSTNVSGSGIATLTFQYFSNFGGGYVLSDIRYDFAPIPEPTTLLLLGTGLASLAARRRKRQRS